MVEPGKSGVIIWVSVMALIMVKPGSQSHDQTMRISAVAPGVSVKPGRAAPKTSAACLYNPSAMPLRRQRLTTGGVVRISAVLQWIIRASGQPVSGPGAIRCRCSTSFAAGIDAKQYVVIRALHGIGSPIHRMGT